MLELVVSPSSYLAALRRWNSDEIEELENFFTYLKKTSYFPSQLFYSSKNKEFVFAIDEIQSDQFGVFIDELLSGSPAPLAVQDRYVEDYYRFGLAKLSCELDYTPPLHLLFCNNFYFDSYTSNTL